MMSTPTVINFPKVSGILRTGQYATYVRDSATIEIVYSAR